MQVESISAFAGLFSYIAAQILSLLLSPSKKFPPTNLLERSKKQLPHNVGFGGFGESWAHPQNFKLVCQISKGRRKKG